MGTAPMLLLVVDDVVDVLEAVFAPIELGEIGAVGEAFLVDDSVGRGEKAPVRMQLVVEGQVGPLHAVVVAAAGLLAVDGKVPGR